MKNLILILFILTISCKKEKTNDSYLGIVDITVSGSEQALPHFEKGLLLLHSFEYVDSRDEFLEAQKIDSTMLMAYWGEAMTYNHSLWSQQDYDNGMIALDKLKRYSQTTEVTELEKDFIKSVQVLYESDSSKTTRDKNYSDYMSKLNDKYKDNHEVAAFYSLSLLGSVADGRDDMIYGRGAKIAKGILEENPKHPGALHYLIHSYDDPEHAKLALNAADSYAVVAPDASHALHMPSHIYVALGMWDKVVSSNENSYQASVNRMKAKNLGAGSRGFHAFHWLTYGYLQQGRMDDAEKLVVDMAGFANEAPSIYSKSHLVFIKGTYLVESDDWTSHLTNIKIDIDDLNLTTRSKYHFIEGMKAFKTNDKKTLDLVIEEIKKDHDKESYLVSYDDAPFCSGANRNKTTPSMLVETEIMMYQLMALKSWLDQDSESTERHLRKTIALEENLSYSYGPPVIQKPTTELYADWLLIQGRNQDALEQYQATLIRAPKRRKAMLGVSSCEALIPMTS